LHLRQPDFRFPASLFTSVRGTTRQILSTLHSQQLPRAPNPDLYARLPLPLWIETGNYALRHFPDWAAIHGIF
jgi:hypothetical protein